MIQFEVPSFVIIIIFFLQKTAVIQVCIAEGEKARKKAMKIAVGLPGNKATFIYNITNFTTLKPLLFNLLIIVVLVLKNCFPFVGVCDIFRVISSALKGQNRDQTEVKGDDFDPVKLVTLLRKKVGHAIIVSFAEDKKEEKKDEKKDEPKIQCPYGPPYLVCGIRDPCNDTNVCSIL